MAESELGVLSTQCLDRRTPDKQTLTSEIAAWEENRNTHHAKPIGNSQPQTPALSSKDYTLSLNDSGH
jgi:hypothetical protein